MKILKNTLYASGVIFSLWVGVMAGGKIFSTKEIVIEEKPIYKFLTIEKEIEPDEIEYELFKVTAYSACDSSQGTTDILKTGYNIDDEIVKNLSVIATDEEVIPLYSLVEIKGLGCFISLDTGGLIKGNRIDILMDTKDEAIEFGIQEYPARIISGGVK